MDGLGSTVEGKSLARPGPAERGNGPAPRPAGIVGRRVAVAPGCDRPRAGTAGDGRPGAGAVVPAGVRNRAAGKRAAVSDAGEFRPIRATVSLPARASKHRKADILPLRPDTAELLRLHLASKLPTARAFSVPKRNKTAGLLRADLDAARAAWLRDTADPGERSRREKSTFLAYQDAEGRYADFHALRHSFLLNLAKSGVHPKVAKCWPATRVSR